MTHKYFKPKSLTWWSGIAMVMSGGFIAAEPLHVLTNLAVTLQAIYADASPAMLINAGLAIIGLRGAQG
jgi:hypothetical protein